MSWFFVCSSFAPLLGLLWGNYACKLVGFSLVAHSIAPLLIVAVIIAVILQRNIINPSHSLLSTSRPNNYSTLENDV